MKEVKKIKLTDAPTPSKEVKKIRLESISKPEDEIDNQSKYDVYDNNIDNLYFQKRKLDEN